VTIRILPDDVLLETFDFYMDELVDRDYDDDRWWYTLVHVCQKWRNVVFASPRRLNLQLRCTRTRSVREMLDIWPELPIVIKDYDGSKMVEGADNVIAALDLKHRVSQINFWSISSSELERFAAVMQDPFPALTRLSLVSFDQMVPAMPVMSDSFLGGSAPRLQYLRLHRIPFLALPKLLSSATDLVDLCLWNTPHSGYISPKAIVACLCADEA
jgi:hypothetical protein